MIVLIGSGAHAEDIIQTLRSEDWTQFAHHELWQPTPNNYDLYIGINDPQVRAHVAAEMGVKDNAWVHPDAHLYHSVRFGHGTHINYGVHAVRTKIGNHTTIGPCVAIAGDVTIGHRVFVGIGANIGNLVTIGNDAVIGAGSVVLKDVPRGQTWAGNPARRIR